MPEDTRARCHTETRSTLVLVVALSVIATLSSVPASAQCIDPNACLCGHNAVVRSVSAETPWIVEVKQILNSDTACPLTVGEEVELHQMMDPEYEVPNLGLAGSGDPISTYAPGADMGSGDIPVRPDLRTGNDLIASIHCGELLAWYLIVDGDVAACNPIIQKPDRVPPELPLDDAIRANSSDQCGTIVAEILPPPECNDSITHEVETDDDVGNDLTDMGSNNSSNGTSDGQEGCSTASTSSPMALLLVGMFVVGRFRRRGDVA